MPLLRELIGSAWPGIEVHYIAYRPGHRRRGRRRRRRARLIATGGADYHGDTSTYAETHAALNVPESRDRPPRRDRRRTARTAGASAGDRLTRWRGQTPPSSGSRRRSLRQPGSGSRLHRRLDTGRLIHARIRQSPGAASPGSIVSGIAFLSSPWFARDTEPASAILLLGFVLSVRPDDPLARVPLAASPPRSATLSARRRDRACRDAATIDSIANGLARGRLRVPGLADDGAQFELAPP